MPLMDEGIDVADAPPSINPYEVLSVDQKATADQIKSAYRKAALRWHPDKASDADKDTAKSKFQEIAFAYAILSDDRRRKRYDVTGRTEESLDVDGEEFDWTSYYRTQYSDIITGESIAQFSKEYKGSDEEREALLAAYQSFEGDMDAVYEEVMTSDPVVDDERFRKIINEAIDAGEVEGYPAFTKESKKSIRNRIERAKKDGQEAEQHAKDIGVYDKLFGDAKTKGKKKGDADSGLAALIQQRQKGRSENFLADLEAKYAPKKKGKRAEPVDEPPEELFQKNAKRSKTESETKKSKRAKT